MAKNISFKEVSYAGPEPSILMFPDDFKAFAQTFDDLDATAVSENGRKFIKAGTVWPSNDAAAKGVVLHSMDVTDGAATGAVIYAGSIKASALPAAVSAEAKAALTRITIF